MSTCNVYKNGLLLGAGAVTNGATTITSWVPTADNAVVSPYGANFVGRNVQVLITSSTDIGKVFQAKITADDGLGTLTFTQQGASGATVNLGNPFAT